jgi:nuclear cap-binding protein subunit 1
VYTLDNRRNNYNNNNSNYQRRPYDRPPPPESKEDEMEDIEIRLKGLIIKIGDKVNRYIISFKNVNSFIK